MPGPRQLVPPPSFAPGQYGLWTTVDDRSILAPDRHWRNGIKWQDLCGIGSTTYDPSCLGTTPATKAANITTPNYAATPFTPFVEIDCSPVGYTVEEHQARAAEALSRVESWQVERAFWTGAAGGDADIVYPHLAANAVVVQTTPNETVTITLQCAATTVTGSTLLDVTEGIGRLEQALGNCLVGRGVIHIPLVLGEQLFRANAVRTDGPQLRTQAGNLVALGAGYPGTGPDGTSVPNAVWIYATGPVFGYRSPTEQFRLRDSLDRSENTARMIAERTYVLGFSCCCLYAVLVSLGGIVTGQPLGAF